MERQRAGAAWFPARALNELAARLSAAAPCKARPPVANHTTLRLDQLMHCQPHLPTCPELFGRRCSSVWSKEQGVRKLKGRDFRTATCRRWRHCERSCRRHLGGTQAWRPSNQTFSSRTLLRQWQRERGMRWPGSLLQVAAWPHGTCDKECRRTTIAQGLRHYCSSGCLVWFGRTGLALLTYP